MFNTTTTTHLAAMHLECLHLGDKIRELKAFGEREKAAGINSWDQALIRKQIHAMERYLEVLDYRIGAESEE